MRVLGTSSVLALALLASSCQGSINGSDPYPVDSAPSCAVGILCGTECCTGDQICDESLVPPTCVIPESCDDGLRNQDESDVDCGGALCEACTEGQACAQDGDCDTGVCTLGECMLCRAGSFGCFGNWVRVCADDESSWEDVEHCDAIAGSTCSAEAGACVAATPLGNDNTNPTGTYYQYAYFTTENSPFLGGADVDSFVRHGPDTDEHLIYVNRDGAHVDLYQVTILDSDEDGKIEPNQHPDNPEEPGPIEERVLTLLQTYDVPIGGTHNNEMFVTGDSIVFAKSYQVPGALFEYDIATGTVEQIVTPTVGIWNQVIGYDDVNDRWYAAVPYERYVYSFDPVENEWVLEFAYPDLSGDHSDGLEVVTDPKTHTPYVYVSDMTSDFLGQYTKEADGTWTQRNLFHYNQAGAADVEGMGFGAFNHFWATNEGYGAPAHALYEIGGGDLDDFVIE